ncbi:MAG: divalent metal cation transporter [Alphaproteobacteria bacterium]|nr:divalent metal cation transporter [Alphaproteobacteria bacterium]
MKISLSSSFSRRVLTVLGPGLVVMLADTDAGSIITAAQSGAQQGYKLLPLQLLLIPVLYIVQELTIRLGLVTGQGHGELIRKYFGAGWAWLSVSTLAVACVGALISELSGLAGVAQLFGIPVWIMMSVTVGFLMFVVITGSYRSVERIAICFGLFELAFVGVVFCTSPDMGQVMADIKNMPLRNADFLYLAVANVGAVIMPWMIFYQQSAVVDKGLKASDLKIARIDTALGAVLTQVVMISVLVTVAATIGSSGNVVTLNDVPHIAEALSSFLGDTAGRVVFALGLSGAALVATIVVALTAAWGLGEVIGYKRSLHHKPEDAPWFYGIFSVVLIFSGVFVASGFPLVKLAVGVEVMNALLLPIVLGFLFLLARKALPEDHRIKGWYAVVVGMVVSITAVFGLFGGIMGIVAE